MSQLLICHQISRQAVSQINRQAVSQISRQAVRATATFPHLPSDQSTGCQSHSYVPTAAIRSVDRLSEPQLRSHSCHQISRQAVRATATFPQLPSDQSTGCQSHSYVPTAAIRSVDRLSEPQLRSHSCHQISRQAVRATATFPQLPSDQSTGCQSHSYVPTAAIRSVDRLSEPQLRSHSCHQISRQAVRATATFPQLQNSPKTLP